MIPDERVINKMKNLTYGLTIFTRLLAVKTADLITIRLYLVDG